MQGGNSPSSYVAQRSYGRCGGWVHGRMNPYLLSIYIYIIPPLGAYKSQLGGTYISSLLFYTVNFYCDSSIYIYIFIFVFYYIKFHSSCPCLLLFLHAGYIPLQQFEMQFWASVWCQLCVYVHIWPELKTCSTEIQPLGWFISCQGRGCDHLGFKLWFTQVVLVVHPGHVGVANSPGFNWGRSEVRWLEPQLPDRWNIFFGLVILVRSSKWQGEARWQKGKGPLLTALVCLSRFQRKPHVPKVIQLSCVDGCLQALTFTWHLLDICIRMSSWYSTLATWFACADSRRKEGWMRSSRWSCRGGSVQTRCRLGADSVQIIHSHAVSDRVRCCRDRQWFDSHRQRESRQRIVRTWESWDCLVKNLWIWIFFKPGNVHGIWHLLHAVTCHHWFQWFAVPPIAGRPLPSANPGGFSSGCPQRLAGFSENRTCRTFDDLRRWCWWCQRWAEKEKPGIQDLWKVWETWLKVEPENSERFSK